ncbi:MAG: type II secretion system secretin GspD [SAR324 cluster bacterium]|nr:type II secretion system secretin GspD [SAR324 cluster bacterium]
MTLVAVILLACSFSASAQKKRGKKISGRGAPIEMNFKNVDLVNFISSMSTALGMAVIWDEKDIKGKITLVSPRKFGRGDALKIFETVLALHGYTTIRRKNSPVIQIVPIKDASRIPSPTRRIIEELREGNVFLTQIIPLRFADANQVKGALTPLISKAASLAVYLPANVILLTDTEANIRRVLEVVKELDIAPDDIEFKVISLKYASARKLEPILKTLISAKSTGKVRQQKGRATAISGVRAKVVAEDHTNSLIIVADPFTLLQLEDLVSILDVPGAVPDRGIKVYRLQHADAESLQKILKGVKQDLGKKSAAKGVKRTGGSNISISADKATNSLIVFGSAEVIESMDELVRQLDIRRPQVFVEALIMEMTLEKSLQLGVNWQGTVRAGQSAIGIGNPGAAPRTLAESLATGSGAVLGIVGNEINFQGQSFASFSAFIQATRTDQDLNILANPQILTLNNEQAEINVSQVVPISSKILRDANQNTTTQFEFKDIGIILKITPQITGGNKVRLIIDQESSSVAAKQFRAGDQQAITTLKRSLKTKVLVDNDTTIAIGGLIQDQEVETITKVPCLGDIPVLGYFFKTRSEEVRKTNLIVFIRPRIILSREDMEKVSGSVQRRFDKTRRIRRDTENILRQDFGMAPELEPEPEPQELQQSTEQEPQESPQSTEQEAPSPSPQEN